MTISFLPQDWFLILPMTLFFYQVENLVEAVTVPSKSIEVLPSLISLKGRTSVSNTGVLYDCMDLGSNQYSTEAPSNATGGFML
jgi:hypothetical protein